MKHEVVLYRIRGFKAAWQSWGTNRVIEINSVAGRLVSRGQTASVSHLTSLRLLQRVVDPDGKPGGATVWWKVNAQCCIHEYEVLTRMKGSHRRWELVEQHTTEERLGLACRMKRRQPCNVPLVLGRAAQCRVGTYQELRVSAPGHLTLAQLQVALRTRMEVHSRHSLIYFIGNELVPLTCSLASLHEKHAQNDYLLYITFCEENVQG